MGKSPKKRQTQAANSQSPSAQKLSPQSPASPQGPQGDVLNMDGAIAMLNTTRPTFYRWLREGKIKAYRAGRQWRFQKEDLQRFLKGQGPNVDLPVSPLPLVEQLEAAVTKLGVRLDPRPQDTVTHVVNLMILLAYRQRASDIHLAPLLNGKEWTAVLRNRVDGVLHQVAEFDNRLLPAVLTRWKQMGAMNPAETRMPQDCRIGIKIDGSELDIRANLVPTSMGESLTARLLRRDAVLLNMTEIGFADSDRQRLIEAIKAPLGLVIVNGPTGSGKTTTLYNCLGMLASEEQKVMTIEDPVEYFFPWAIQSQTNMAAGYDFGRAMRAFLRQDPDVIMVGEIRDLGTLEICCQAALTGHMVLTTLHAQNCATAYRRMVEMGLAPFLLADSVRLVTSQLLVRRLCPDCSRPVRLTAADETFIAEMGVKGGLAIGELTKEFREPVGCPKCGQIGYSGRRVIAETMPMSPALSKAIRDGQGADELQRIAVSEGMTTMAADGIRKAAAGLTSLREVRRVVAM